MKYAAIWLLFINLTGIGVMGLDKHKAILHRRRIPERTLFLIALLGGSLGTWIGMYLFRHKTRHLRFVLGIPLILLIQAAVLLWVLY